MKSTTIRAAMNGQAAFAVDPFLFEVSLSRGNMVISEWIKDDYASSGNTAPTWVVPIVPV